MPEFMAQKMISSQQHEGVETHLLGRHEIENYLLSPKPISDACKTKGKEISENTVMEIIVEVGETQKAAARFKSRETAKLINRHLKFLRSYLIVKSK